MTRRDSPLPLASRGRGGAQRLPAPLLTPSTKDIEHDKPITPEEAAKIVGQEVFDTAKAASLALFERGTERLAELDILLADTKFEFGVLPYDVEETPILADEVLSPDSSRFWPQESWRPGGPQVSFDKQFVRQYLMQVDWDRNPPAPGLPDSVVRQTREKYFEAYRRLTGVDFK